MPNKKARSLSPSALSAYEWCPANWLGQYHLRLPGTEFVNTADTAVGKAVHRAMKKLNERRRDGKPTMPAELETWATDYWAEEKIGIPTPLTDIDNTYYLNWAVCHASELAALTRGQVPVEIEKYLSIPLVTDENGDVLWYIGGILDAQLANGQGIVCRVDDYKTANNKAFTSRDSEKYRIQAAIYAAIIRHLYGSIPEVHLLTSDSENVEDYLVPLTATTVDDTLEHARRVAAEIDRMLETGTPFPKPRHCQYCPLGGNCPTTVAPLVAA